MTSWLLLFCIFYLSSGKPTTAEPDVHHIDFRVGKILSAKKHPDADTLFVEESKFFSLFSRCVLGVQKSLGKTYSRGKIVKL